MKKRQLKKLVKQLRKSNSLLQRQFKNDWLDRHEQLHAAFRESVEKKEAETEFSNCCDEVLARIKEETQEHPETTSYYDTIQCLRMVAETLEADQVTLWHEDATTSLNKTIDQLLRRV